MTEYATRGVQGEPIIIVDVTVMPSLKTGEVHVPKYMRFDLEDEKDT